MDTPPSTLTDVQKVAGGVELEVTFEDGHAERVKVRQLKIIKEFDRYLAVQDDETAEVELVCDKPKGWAETLAPESFDRIADLSQELNLPLFRNRYRRLRARSEAINPGLAARIEKEAVDRVSEAVAASPALSSRS
jgi:hypothetical protein